MISAAPRIQRATATVGSVTERDSSRRSRWSRVPTSCSSAATRRFSTSSSGKSSSRQIPMATSPTSFDSYCWLVYVDVDRHDREHEEQHEDPLEVAEEEQLGTLHQARLGHENTPLVYGRARNQSGEGGPPAQ